DERELPGRARRCLLQQARNVRAMDQGRQGRAQVDATIMLLVHRQRGASSVTRAGLYAWDRRTATRTGPSVGLGGLDASSPREECVRMTGKKGEVGGSNAVLGAGCRETVGKPGATWLRFERSSPSATVQVVSEVIWRMSVKMWRSVFCVPC